MLVRKHTTTQNGNVFAGSKFRLYFFPKKTESRLGRYVKSVISKESKDTDNHFCHVFGCTGRDTDAENRQNARTILTYLY